RPAAIPSASRTAVHLPSAALPPDVIAERSPEEQERAQAARIADLDKKLRDEPFDTKWAREQEGIIARAVTGSKNDGLAVPLPDRMDATCQSTLCRITMTYADEEDAMQMHTRLTLGLRGSISSARAFYRPNQRGGMDLLVYAGAVD